MTLAEIKQQLDNRRPIRVQGLLKHREETPVEFLVKFFVNWNETHDTIYADIKNSESTQAVQTASGMRRSFGDIYQIIKYYYPGTQIRTIRNLLYEGLFEEMPQGFRTSWCEQTKQRMWYFDPEDETAIMNKTHKDEFGNTWEETLNL